MKLKYAVVGMILFLAACAGKPLYNVQDHPIPLTAQSLPLDRLEAAIIEAGQSRSWQFQRVSMGTLRATQVVTARNLSAEVEIVFDQKAYSIRYISSQGMKEQDGTIHPHYNMWIGNLERDIYTRMSNVSFGK